MVYFILSRWQSLAKALQAGWRIWGGSVPQAELCISPEATGSCRDSLSTKKQEKCFILQGDGDPAEHLRSARKSSSSSSVSSLAMLKAWDRGFAKATRQLRAVPTETGTALISHSFSDFVSFFSHFFIKLFSMEETLCWQCLGCCYFCWELSEKFGKGNLKYVLAG